MKISKYLVPLFALLVSLTTVNSASAALTNADIISAVTGATGDYASGSVRGTLSGGATGGSGTNGIDSGDVLRLIQSFTQQSDVTTTPNVPISVGNQYMAIVYAVSRTTGSGSPATMAAGSGYFSDLTSLTADALYSDGAVGYILTAQGQSTNPFSNSADFAALQSAWVANGIQVAARLDLAGTAPLTSDVTYSSGGSPVQVALDYKFVFEIAAADTGVEALFADNADGGVVTLQAGSFQGVNRNTNFTNFDSTASVHTLNSSQTGFATMAVVPEPNSFLVLAGLGVFGLGYRRREKKA